MISKKNNIFRVLRQCMGLSLNEMAETCGISAVYLNELELGKKSRPSDEYLEKIASACGIQIETIKFFLEEQSGKALDYQKCLLNSLETLANALRKEKEI